MAHPVVLLSGDVATNHRGQLTVAEISRTIRTHDAEVIVDRGDGLRERSAINLDTLHTIWRSQLLYPMTTLSTSRLADVERAIHVALGLAMPCSVK